MRHVALFAWCAACQPAGPAAPAAPPKVDLPDLYVQAKEVEVFAAPGGTGGAIRSLSLAAKVSVQEWKDGWMHVTAPGGVDGWIPARYVGAVEPTFELMLERHDKTPPGDSKARKMWLDRAAAMNADSLAVLKRQLAMHMLAGEARAAAKVERQLETLRSTPPTGRLGLVVAPTPGHARPGLLSEKKADLAAGHVVALGATTSPAPDGTPWWMITHEGESMWAPYAAIEALDAPLFESYQEGTSSYVQVTPTALANRLFAADLAARVRAGADLAARRMFAAVVLPFVCVRIEEAKEGETEAVGYAEITNLWREMMDDADSSVRATAAAALADCIKEEHKRLRRYHGFHAALRNVVGSAQERGPGEKKELRRLAAQGGDATKDLQGDLK